MFKAGDIITGTEVNNGYSYTNSKSLMLVTKLLDEDMMNVKILFSSMPGCIEDVYPVDNTEEKFRLTTFEEYETEHPECYKMNFYNLRDILGKYGLEYVRPKKSRTEIDSNAYVLSDEMRKELLNEMKALLETYHYHPTEEGLNIILDEWCTNKADLIRLFEKHPNYNGKFQIAFDCDYTRKIDFEAVNDFRDWLFSSDVKGLFKKEIVLGDYSYEELVNIVGNASTMKRMFESFSFIENINGKTHDDAKNEYNHFLQFMREYETNHSVYIYNNRAYDRELYLKKECIDKLSMILGWHDVVGQFINNNAKCYFNEYFPDAKIRLNQKMSRAVNKVLGMLGVDKLPDYNKEFAKFSDAVNPLKIKRHTVISLHPVDYFTMSFGNSWSSCQTIDKRNDRKVKTDNHFRGCSSSGTESYMLDGTSCIFYTVDSEYNGNLLELENKINRCMFHYYDNQIVQGRVYPQSNDSGANDLYKDIREIAQKVFSDILEVPNYWTNKRGTSNCNDVTYSYGTHYRDYLNFDNCNISTLKDDRETHEPIKIGHNPICPCCGEEHTRDGNIECDYCNEEN